MTPCAPPRWIGITMGDPSGIGPEVLAKALAKPSIRNLAHFRIIGDYEIYRMYSKKRWKNCVFDDLKILPLKTWKAGTLNKASGKAALAYLNKAVELLKNGEISALVTAPVNKESISAIDPSFQGHTEYLARAFHRKHVGMMFVAGRLRTVLVTRHIPVQEISRTLTPSLIFKTIQLTHLGLKNIFKINHPSIAVCGLNPHAGEGGHIGLEERKVIIPALEKCRKNGMRVEGPFAADSLFASPALKRFDAVVAMYHDQGLAPVKALCFNKLVNLTIGLPFIRTSPAHGTAFDIAGQNKADASSMGEAIQLAVQLSQRP